MKKEKKDFGKRLMQSILTFFLFYFRGYLEIIPILIFNLNPKKISPDAEIWLMLFSNACLLVILGFIYWKDLKQEWLKFKNHLVENLDIGFRYWFMGLLGMCVSNIILTFFLQAGGATNEKMVQDMITTLPFIMLLSAGILAPIIEELIFRKSFRNILSNKWIFIFVSGIVFGSLHVIFSFHNPVELLYAIPYSCLGISFAFMYEKTDTVFTSISMHMIHNTALTLISIFF